MVPVHITRTLCSCCQVLNLCTASHFLQAIMKGPWAAQTRASWCRLLKAPNPIMELLKSVSASFLEQTWETLCWAFQPDRVQDIANQSSASPSPLLSQFSPYPVEATPRPVVVYPLPDYVGSGSWLTQVHCRTSYSPDTVNGCLELLPLPLGLSAGARPV